MSNYSTLIKKEKNKDTYRVFYSYISPKDGKRHRTCKRGFELQKDAKKWVKDVLPDVIQALEQTGPVDAKMTLAELVGEYLSDFHSNMNTRESTFISKQYLINSKILPYWGDKIVYNITPNDVRKWQEQLQNNTNPRNGKKYTGTYLRTVENQLSAIFNYAVTYHGLTCNPILRRMGCKQGQEKDILTIEEYREFISELELYPEYYYIVQTMYWTGMRVGEALALTAKDIIHTQYGWVINISKSVQNLNGKKMVTLPKTDTSIRSIRIPDILGLELQEYMNGIYGLKPDDFIFDLTKGKINDHIKAALQRAGIDKHITNHCLRHSHISNLAGWSYGKVDIAERVGHKKDGNMTNYYTHRLPTTEDRIAKELNEKMKG